MNTIDKVISKESVMTNIEIQINHLVQSFQNKINVLETKNLKLLEENIDLKRRIKVKDLKIEELLNSQTKTNKKERKNTFVLESINDLSMTQRISKQIDALENYNRENDYHLFSKILNNLIADTNGFSGVEIKRLTKALIGMFRYKNEDINDMDQAYESSLRLLQKFISDNEAKSFLSTNKEMISKRIIESKRTKLINELANTYSAFQLPIIEREYLNKILKEYADILKTIDEKSLLRLFWRCFNHGLELQFLKAMDTSTNFSIKDEPEVQIYFLYKDMLDDKIRLEDIEEKISEQKRKIKRFSTEEQTSLFQSLDKRINKKIAKKKNRKLNKEKGKRKSISYSKQGNVETVSVRKMEYIVKLPNEIPVLPGTSSQLQEEWVDLAVFKDKSLRGTPTYSFERVLSNNQKNNVYVTPKLLQAIKHNIGNSGFIDIRSISKKSTVIGKNNSFAWPNTEIKGNATKPINDKVQFNEESELKKLGYQITGLSKEKRWNILERAVKKLGLKKVALTIAQNVKLRKGQKNGESKFSYAIAQWEYDLDKLKRHYYKNDFKWPVTKLKN